MYIYVCGCLGVLAFFKASVRDNDTHILTGHIGRTFEEEREQDESSDPFSIRANIIQNGAKKILGIDTAHPRYALGKWCYDTPGTVQPDQVLCCYSLHCIF